MNELWAGVITIASAIVGVAILAVLVGSQSQTIGVIGAAGNAFATDLRAAEGPVTGGSGLSGNNIFGQSAFSGGANPVTVY